MDDPDEKRHVFVGLGNPGKKYEMTRHNMGYLVVQAFAHVHGFQLKEERRFLASVARGKIQDVDVHLILPTTYMNESGQAVRRYMDYFKLKPQEVVVVSDDVALPFGEVRLRSQGSAGGHNGLKSVERHLGTKHYARLRMGIEFLAERRKELSGYVLDRFAKSELERLPGLLEDGVRVLEHLLTETVGNVMTAVNVKKKKTTQEPHESL